MKNILAAWRLKHIQEYVNISLHLQNHDKTLADVQEYLRNSYDITKSQETNTESKKSFIRKPIKKCPNCNGIMKLFSDKTDDSKCQWECCKTCSTQPCGYVEKINKSIENYIEELNA